VASRRQRYRSAPRKSRALPEATARLAEKLATLRKRRDLTQEEAADRATIEVKHLQLLERGGGNPTLATLIALAKALGVEVYELLKPPRKRRPSSRPQSTRS
jgi:transcriptional regulator with XRE-family HTH domain